MKNSDINGQYSRIEKSTKFKGDIVSEADFRIDGVLEGTIKTLGKIIVGKEGKVNGNLDCETADVEGEIKGSLKVKNILFLKATSNIEGEVLIGKLIVESGATFNANCSMKSQENNQVKPLSEFSKNHEKTA
jgi:cytoskeletal protein CcmA (bactofilin family)|tara:strand:- start:21883 stop:22278 length:396 start_codon:yes stop_codon:yes gene_type:complete